VKKDQIEGGATLWARQTLESEIFYNKPDKWFKIWFYLVNRVSHKDTKRYKRGETFLQYEWLCDATGASQNQVKKCLMWLRDSSMIRTRRSTRGTNIEILNYSRFQTLDNYYYKIKEPHKELEKNQRRTREELRYYKNDKNDKNILETSVSDVEVSNPLEKKKEDPFVLDEYIKQMRSNTRPHIRLIGWYFETRKSYFPDKKTIEAEISRWSKDATFLIAYGNDKIVKTYEFVKNKFPEEWNLNTIKKYISEN